MRKLSIQETASFRRPANVLELGREPIVIEHVLMTVRAWVDEWKDSGLKKLDGSALFARTGRMVLAPTVANWCRRII